MLTVNPGHFEAHRNLTEGDRLGDDAILEELLNDLQDQAAYLVDVSRTLEVDFDAPAADADGSPAHPFVTIQAAVDAAEASTPAVTASDPVLIRVRAGVTAENVIVKKAGVLIVCDGTAIAPVAGVPLVLSNATVESIATFHTTGTYSSLDAEATPVAGPTGNLFQGLALIAPTTANALELLGAAGDAGGGATTEFCSGVVFDNCTFDVGTGKSIYARNVKSVKFNRCETEGDIDTFNVASITFNELKDGGKFTAEYDAMDAEGQPQGGFVTALMRMAVINGKITVNRGVTLTAVDAGCPGEVETNGDGAIVGRALHISGVLDGNGTGGISLEGGFVGGAVDLEGGVSFYSKATPLLSTLTIAAGAGLVYMDGGFLVGALTDPGDKLVRRPGLLADPRVLYVSKAGSANGDGSEHSPFLTIQAAVGAAEALVPAPSDTAPALIVIGVGTFVEEVVVKKTAVNFVGQGQFSTIIAPTTGVALTYTNATLASLALYRVAWDYTQLAAEAVPEAGPWNNHVCGMMLAPPTGGRALECLGVQGDDTALKTDFLGGTIDGVAGRGLWIENVGGLYVAAPAGGYAVHFRNTNLVNVQSCNYTTNSWLIYNTSIVTFYDSYLSAITADYVTGDVCGEPTMGRVRFGARKGSQLGDVTLNHSAKLDYNRLVRINSLTMNDTSIAIGEAAYIGGNVDCNGTAALTLRRSYIAGNIDVEAGVTATLDATSVKGTTTIAAGAGVVTANGCEFIGAITDSSKKLVRIGELNVALARTGHPRIAGFVTNTTTGHKADGTVDLELKGSNLLQGQTFASITPLAGLVISACVPGAAGNAYSVEIIDSLGGGLTVALAGSKMTIDKGGAAPTKDQIATAVNGAGSAARLKLRCVSDAGAEAVPVFGEANLTGGIGGGFIVEVGGVAANIAHDTGTTPAANLTEGALKIKAPTIAGTWAAGDVIEVFIKSHLTATSLGGLPVIA